MPKPDIQRSLDQNGVDSPLNFLNAWKKAPIDEATGRAKPDFKEPPLWFFPVATHVNNAHQIQVLKDNVTGFEGTQDPTATYPKRFTIKVLEPYELTESDAPGFLFITGNMRVNIPHLRFRVHSVTWPRIQGLTHTLPLVKDTAITELFSEVEIDLATAPAKEPDFEKLTTDEKVPHGAKTVTAHSSRKSTSNHQAKKVKVGEK